MSKSNPAPPIPSSTGNAHASGKRALVIGGTGFVGSALIPELHSEGFALTLLNRGTRVVEETAQLTADRNDEEQMRRAAGMVDCSFDVIIDTSAYTPLQTKLAWKLLSHTTPHWIHLSSAAVYREMMPERPYSEQDPIGGAAVWGAYGQEKSACDLFLLKQHSQAAVTILRPPYLYGPGNDNDRESFVWSRALRGSPVVIPSDGRTQIQFLHVTDLASAIARAASRPPARSAVYNVASPEVVTLQEWVSLLCRVARVEDAGILAGAAARGLSARQYFPFRDFPCTVATEAIMSELDWRPAYTLASGFSETFQRSDRESLRSRPIEDGVEMALLRDMSTR